MSSTIAATPGNPSYVRSISFWNTSCAEFTPNGSRLNRYLPNGVLNVMRRELFLSSFTCQYPLVASSTVNTRAPCSFAAMSSTVGHRTGVVFAFESFVEVTRIQADPQRTVLLLNYRDGIYPVRGLIYFDDYSQRFFLV